MFLDFLTVTAGERGAAAGRRVAAGRGPDAAPSRPSQSRPPIEPPLIDPLPPSRQRIRTELAPGEAVSVRILCLGARRAARRGRHRAMVRTDGERSPYMTNVRPKNQEIKYRYSRPLFSRRIRLRSNRLFRAFWETRSERPSSLWTSAVVTPSGWLDNSKMRGPSWLDPF